MKKFFALSLGLVLIISGCNLFSSEKDRFIDATVETTCLLFEAEDFFDPALEADVKEVYSKFGFDVEDEEGMQALTTKYESDEEVQAAILAALGSCSEAPDLSGLQDSSAVDVSTEEVDAAMEELDAVMEDSEKVE